MNKSIIKPISKQTAGNNAELRALKLKVNTPIYKKASEILNEQGRDDMIAFLYTVDTNAFGMTK